MDGLIGYLSEVEQLDGVLTIPKTVGELGEKTITENGTYDASDDGYEGYSQVVANVPNSYSSGDEGKVVDNGALVSQTSATYTSNNTYDTTKISSVTVNVSGGGSTVDYPVFNIEYFADIVDVQEISCNMYYSDIYDYVTGSGQYDNACGAMVDAFDIDAAESFTFGCVYKGTANSQLVFVVMDGDTPIADIGVAQDETLTVTAPSSALGTEGTPTATKGAVSNHSVAVTPSVTNVAGYINGGTKTGTAVTVSASELVSGSETKTDNGTYDVTNLASLVVAVPSASGVSF